jgi:hypothetical protein
MFKYQKIMVNFCTIEQILQLFSRLRRIAEIGGMDPTSQSNAFWKDHQTPGHIIFFMKRVALKVIQNENREFE